MRSDYYPGYDFVTNFDNKRLTQVLLCARLCGLEDYYIDNKAYDNMGCRLPETSALIVKDADAQKFEIHKYFQYNNEISLRLEKVLKKNGLISKDYTPWTHDYSLYLGCEAELFQDAEIKYYKRGEKK